MTTINQDPIYPKDRPVSTCTGYPSPDENTDMLDGEYIFQSVSEEVFPDDIETAQEVH